MSRKIARTSRAIEPPGAVHFPQYFGFAGFALAPFKAPLVDPLLPIGWSFIFPKPKTQEITMIDIALFGAGRIGKIHAANLVRQPGARLKYVVDMHLPSAQALAQRPFCKSDERTIPPRPVFSRLYSAVTIAAYRPVALG